MHLGRTRALLASLFLIALTTGTFSAQAQSPLSAYTQQQTEFLPVDEAYELSVIGTTERGALLQWLIAPDYYLYRHAFAAKARTSSQDIEVALAIPDGLAKTDEFFGDVEVYYGALDASVELAESAELIELSITYQGCADAGLCYPPETKTFLWHTASGEVQKGKLSPTVLDTNAPQGSGDEEDFGLIAALVFALLGGVILNIMPCVFPILSLKALSFTRGGAQSHRRSSLVYSAGVIVSFVGIAAVLIAIQQTGKLIGWGFQLQNTGFVIGLAYLFTLMGLSLNGLLHFGTSMMNVGQSLTEKDGDAGSFFPISRIMGRAQTTKVNKARDLPPRSNPMPVITCVLVGPGRKLQRAIHSISAFSER